MLKFLTTHRGFEAESELVDLLGKPRLKALFSGEEPRLGELIEIARILEVPLSTFQIHEPGSMPELEIVIAELYHTAAGMTPSELSQLVEHVSAIAEGGVTAQPPSSGLPGSLLRAVRRASE